MAATPSVIGDRPRRREDLRFITGRGNYLDDLAFAGLAHAVVLRAPHAHGQLERVDTRLARVASGVLAVMTAEDVRADGLQPLRPSAEANVETGEPFAFTPQPLLAEGKTRYVGEPIALIVAETRGQALDAAELVVVDYVPLPAVNTAAAACAPGAPEISAEVPGNICLDWRTGDAAAVDAAIAAAVHLVELDLDNHRIVTNPMEPRGVVGLWDANTGRYMAYVSSQSIHITRDHTARALGVSPSAVRFVAPDVGGGFGAKNFVYPEHVLILWAAKRVGRPVKWIATRSEGFLCDHQARDHRAEAALALDANGQFLALRVASAANVGAYLVSAGGVQTFQYVHLPGTVYRIPAIDLRVTAVLSNTAPIGVTRGPGFAEAVNIIERLIDAAARQCGFDRAELRRVNMVPAEAMPMTNAFGNIVDSGAFAQTFDRALAAADIGGFAARRNDSEARGLLRGLGFAYHIKATGGSRHENVEIRFEADGTVSLITGTQTIGQGHETTFPQILADRLGLSNESIRLVQGDTDAIRLGGGHGSSRATYALDQADGEVSVRVREPSVALRGQPPHPFRTTDFARLIIERYQPSPTGAGLWMVLLLSVAYSPLAIYAPLFLQRLHSLNPLAAGYMVAGASLAWTAAALAVASLAEEWPARLIVAGPIAMSVGLLGVAVLMAPGPIAALLPPISLMGIGIGASWAFIAQRIMSGAKDGEENIAAASVAPVQQAGIAFGAAVAGLVANASGLGGGLHPGSVLRAAFWVPMALVAAPLAAGAIGVRLNMMTRRSGHEQTIAANGV